MGASDLAEIAAFVDQVDFELSGQSVDPARYAAGRRAFVDYNPLLEINLLEDPICAGDPLFRTVKWGSEVELFILDERSDRKSTRLNSSHMSESRMPSSA